MNLPGSLGYEWDEEMQAWFDVVTGKWERIPGLIASERPLNFHDEFIAEVASNPALDCMGIYTNGWEL